MPRPRSLAAVEKATKISPLPWWATEPVRARPRPARRARRSSWAGCSGASVATTAMQLPAGGRGSMPVADRREDRHAVDPQILCRAEVREHEHADGRIDRGNEAAGRPDAALPAERDHARCPRRRIPGRRRRSTAAPDGAAGVLRLDLHRARVVEPAVVALADDRDHDVVGADGRIRLTRSRDGAVEDAADGHRRGEEDGRLDQPPFRDLEEAGQLACAVQRRRPGRHGTPEHGVARPGQDRGDAGAREAAADGRLGLVADDGDVADAHARDVGDRVRGTGLEVADRGGRARAASTRSCGRA